MEVPRYPLEILPKEMWERIILEVKDSEDLRSLMKASKQLNEIFMSIHHLWLLDMVLRLLAPSTKEWNEMYLKLEDLKSLRLVDKRWCGAVNTFLQNQPHLRPYNKRDDKVNSEKHIWTECVSYIASDYTRRFVYRFGELEYNEERMDKFRMSFEDPNINPFPSRSIHERMQPVHLWNTNLAELWLLEEMYTSIFKKFGGHIWFLKMSWINRGHPDPEEDYVRYSALNIPSSVSEYIWQWIVDSLFSLPNLKSLHLEISKFDIYYLKNADAKKFLQLEKCQLPPMKYLESLQISYFNLHPFPDLFAQQLVSAYCLQLRRLHISAFNWETCGKWTFPSLTEFVLEEITDSLDATIILNYLEAPQLAKLELRAYWTMNKQEMTLRMEEDVFPWIRLFSSLLYLDITDAQFSISESGTLKPPHDSKPSLKYLKIYNSFGVNYNFLRCLPNLQRLQINVNNQPIVWDCSVYPEVRIKLEIETNSLYQSNVWEICPKLKTLSCSYEFDRATYEKLKEGPPEERNLSKSRLDFLHNNKPKVYQFNYESESDGSYDPEYFEEFYESEPYDAESFEGFEDQYE